MSKLDPDWNASPFDLIGSVRDVIKRRFNDPDHMLAKAYRVLNEVLDERGLDQLSASITVALSRVPNTAEERTVWSNGRVRIGFSCVALAGSVEQRRTAVHARAARDLRRALADEVDVAVLTYAFRPSRGQPQFYMSLVPRLDWKDPRGVRSDLLVIAAYQDLIPTEVLLELFS